jgi:hypothetical protein
LARKGLRSSRGASEKSTGPSVWRASWRAAIVLACAGRRAQNAEYQLRSR